MNNAQQLAADLAEVRDYFAKRQIKNYAVVMTAIRRTKGRGGARHRQQIPGNVLS